MKPVPAKMKTALAKKFVKVVVSTKHQQRLPEQKAVNGKKFNC